MSGGGSSAGSRGGDGSIRSTSSEIIGPEVSQMLRPEVFSAASHITARAVITDSHRLVRETVCIEALAGGGGGGGYDNDGGGSDDGASGGSDDGSVDTAAPKLMIRFNGALYDVGDLEQTVTKDELIASEADPNAPPPLPTADGDELIPVVAAPYVGIESVDEAVGGYVLLTNGVKFRNPGRYVVMFLYIYLYIYLYIEGGTFLLLFPHAAQPSPSD
jgi:hypothetical protein